jgi:hypothetical protein
MDAKLARMIRKIENSVPQREDLNTAMSNQLGRIRIRTLAGRDVNGFPFLRKKDGSPSTLYRTGNLLRSLQASADQGEQGLVGRITVTGRAREYAPFVNAKRRFLGASPVERTAVISDLRQGILNRRSDA